MLAVKGKPINTGDVFKWEGREFVVLTKYDEFGVKVPYFEEAYEFPLINARIIALENTVAQLKKELETKIK